MVEQHAALVRTPRSGIRGLARRCRPRAGRADVLADRDIPPFPRSTRDGYAVRSADLAQLPATLEVIGEIKAGETLGQNSGQHRQRASGFDHDRGPVPAGADAVVMVEYTAQRGERVEITRGVAPGENVVPRGAEARQGSCLLDRGLRLNEAAIALAASVGKSRLQVYQRPRVAVLTTGDEIVDVERDSRADADSQLEQLFAGGADSESGRRAGAAADRSRRAAGAAGLIEEGLKSDLLLLTGGVSMGRYDLVEQVLAEMQAEFFFTGAKIQPGRPVVFGDVARAPARETQTISSASGNPVSTMVTFELFARPMIEALAGQTPRKLIFLHARLKSEIRVKTGLKRFLPAILSGEFENSEVELVRVAGIGRHRRDRARELLCRDSAGPRADCRRRMGRGDDAVAAVRVQAAARAMLGHVR